MKLAQAVDLIMAKIDEMDVECVDRFSEWFAYHLANFDFKWDWNSWYS